MLAAAWLDTTLHIGAWVLFWVLILGGLAGTALPIVPGTILIFLGAVAHRFLIGAENSIEILGFVILFVLLLLSFAIDFFSGVVGAKYFGASRWGAGGALVGGIVGICFGLPGLIIGPIIGAVGAEDFFAKKKLKPATKSGWGTIIGATAGVVAKVVVAVWMVGWILIDILLLDF